MGKIVSLRELLRVRRGLARKHKSVVFTNGTFDILHRGHVEYLAAARALGDVLIVGLNTDASIRRIKGKGRPINPNADRAAVLAALASVDFVCLFGAIPRDALSSRSFRMSLSKAQTGALMPSLGARWLSGTGAS